MEIEDNEAPPIVWNDAEFKWHEESPLDNLGGGNEGWPPLITPIIPEKTEKSNKVFQNVNPNLDLVPVKWHVDYTYVNYTVNTGKRGGKEKKRTRLSEYLKLKDKTNHEGVTYEPLKMSENLNKLLGHYEAQVKYNEIKNKIDYYENGKFVQNPIEDEIIKTTERAENHGWNIRKDVLQDLVYAVSRKNKYNPIKDYLVNCESQLGADSQEAISQLEALANSLNSTLPLPIIVKYLKKFMIQMATLATGEETDDTAPEFCLVLQGAQNAGKTFWFRNLLPPELKQSYFLGGRNLDTGNKDHILEMATNWLVELGELGSTFKKSDINTLKAHITADKDRVRPPYAKEAIDKKRRYSLCGTVNEIEFLRDETGDRRFVVFPIQGQTQRDFHKTININAVWGLMYREVLQGAKFNLSKEEEAEVRAMNAPYRQKSKNQEALELYFDLFPESEDEENPFKGQWLTSGQILNRYFEVCNQNDEKLNANSIGRELKKIGVKMKEGKNKSIVYLVRGL